MTPSQVSTAGYRDQMNPQGSTCHFLGPVLGLSLGTPRKVWEAALLRMLGHSDITMASRPSLLEMQASEQQHGQPLGGLLGIQTSSLVSDLLT